MCRIRRNVQSGVFITVIGINDSISLIAQIIFVYNVIIISKWNEFLLTIGFHFFIYSRKDITMHKNSQSNLVNEWGL